MVNILMPYCFKINRTYLNYFLYLLYLLEYQIDKLAISLFTRISGIDSLIY